MSIRTHIIKSTMLLSSLFIVGQVAEAVTIEVGGSLRPRVELVDEGAQGQGVGASKTHTTQQTRVNVKATIDEKASAFIQIQDVRTWGGQTPSSLPPSITRTGTGTSGQVDFHQAYLIVKDALGTGLNVKVGRQEIIFDEHRLFGNIGWIQQAQTFDAARVDTRRDNFGLTGFYAQTVANDSHPTLRSTIPTTLAAQESEVYGARGTYYLGGKDRITAYYYGAFDANAVATVAGGLVQELHTVGLYAAKTFNGIRVRFDGAFQFGDVSQTVDIDANMLTFSVGGPLNIANGARLEFWADYLSGDDNTADLTRRTFSTPYATNHKFYGHVDKFLQIPTTGLIDLVVKFWVKPMPKMKLVAHAHSFRAAEALNAAGGKNLGSEIDLQLHYILAKNTKAVLGYSRYFAGDATNGGVGGDTSLDTNWAFGMITMKF
jgi:hypothetical protein